ncbi:antitoxin Xre/MbcA/ParS-like domain-containing protein [Rhizobium sp. LjRoot258]|uniref:antitoxin Xre/MbcA/ParS-like domain-containing protein n=1 Tax=Rhizobium sp. LjRoot258 TaxID=3342299 RepID=UPI003F4FDC74
METRFGTKRSTLHDWQKRGAVIGLLRGERKHVFPIAQFVDGRPIEGMSEITKINSESARGVAMADPKETEYRWIVPRCSQGPARIFAPVTSGAAILLDSNALILSQLHH